MGGQKRYVATAGVWDIPGLRRRGEMDGAVDKIIAHVRTAGRAGIYTGAGDPYVPGDASRAPTLTGPDRLQHGAAADGSDTLLLVEPDEDPEDLRDRIYRSRSYATVRMAGRLKIADVVYAAIFLRHLEPAPAVHVEAFVDGIMDDLGYGRELGRMLVEDCFLLRDWLGLPLTNWPKDISYAASQGRQLCGTLSIVRRPNRV